MTTTEAVCEQRNLPITSPARGTIIVNDDDITVVQFDPPRHRAMFG
jgi:hypothetical protein